MNNKATKSATKPAAKPITKTATSIEQPVAVEQPKPTSQELALPYDPQGDDVLIELMVNPNKIDVMQPDLIGGCTLGALEVDLSLWLATTRDGTRNYYSGSLNDSVRWREARAASKQARGDKPKIEPLHRLKFYEFRKSSSQDPDFTTPEPFIEANAVWWGSMWVLLPEDVEDVENIRYFVIFSHNGFRPALTEKAKENTSLSVARLLERRKELENASYYAAQQAKRTAVLDTDRLL